MFAGEGDAVPHQHALQAAVSEGMPAKRLSTAFDSVTLYGNDPATAARHLRQGRQLAASVDRHARRHEGAVLGLRPDCSPNTSVSMTINGPAPTILAMFMNTAIDQQLDKFTRRQRARADRRRGREDPRMGAGERARHRAGRHPEGRPGPEHLHLLDRVLAEGDGRHRSEYFVHHNVRNFYSVSISRLPHRRSRREPDQPARVHAVERLHLRRGVPGARHAHRRLRAEPVASSSATAWTRSTRCWAASRAASGRWRCATSYGANERSQKLKYHVPDQSAARCTRRRSQFNDIRTTLQALIAIYDNCNSLHTNAYDEAITTPTEESVRRAMAIQLIINREWGLAKNENPNQGAFIIDELTELVEEAVLKEFETHRRARRRARRDGDRLPARQDPGRVAALRAR